MKIIQKYMPKNYVLVVSGDLHLGAVTVNEDTIKEMVDYVCSTKNCYMTNIGDNIECIPPRDKRFQFSSTPYQTAKEQADAVIKLLKPLRNKLLAIGNGNHEHTASQTFNVGEYIAEGLSTEFGTVSYKLDMINLGSKKTMHKMYFHHGAGSITSNAKDDIQADANKKACLKNKLIKTAHSDCVVMGMGHIHQSIIVPPTCDHKLHLCTTDEGNIKQFYRVQESQNSSYIPPDSRYYFANPSFMKLYDNKNSNYNSYAENFMYSPSEIGYSKIIVEDGMVVGIECVKL